MAGVIRDGKVLFRGGGLSYESGFRRWEFSAGLRSTLGGFDLWRLGGETGAFEGGGPVFSADRGRQGATH
jgi:hypothetical protein